MGALKGVLAMALVAGGGASPTSAGPVVETGRFAFYSDPWINLHHFLYQWSRADRGIGSGRQAVEVTERSQLESLSVRDREAWNRAVEFYATHIAERGEFDEGMWRLKAALTELGGDPDVPPPDVIPGVAEALQLAMPVYLSRWWTEQNRQNRAWIEEVAPLVREHEEEYVVVARRSFGGEWPAGRVRVDLSGYANWAGAYTSNLPTHTVLSSRDPDIRQIAGMESVFHEVSHDRSLERASRRAIDQAFGELGARANPNLWHALIFYTAGSFTRDVARDSGQPDYVPYAVAGGLVDFPNWVGLWDVLEAEWPPVLAGRRDRRAALAAVARRLAAEGAGG